MSSLTHRFIQNCVPQSNGILLGSGISIAYFILSLFSLLLTFGLYESAQYSLKKIIYWTRITTLFYGIAIGVLGLLIFIIELP